ncbi:DUF3519 domain-containing protein [Helicobacter pylori]|uniref:DUF3519 domain-containing protein n=2 Tax=Helicobacter pylori TaxID=210 RepID=UPI000BEAD528|nr:DUF3519 domain-containing protein [Helicobacter pylori]
MKRALERSHSISEFSKNLELSAQKSHFSNNTLKIIEELNNGIKQASEEIKEATKTSNLVKSIREQDTRPFEVIEDKEAFFKDLNKNLKDNATPLPKGMSIEEFKQSLESVENKDRFLDHLKTRENNPEERLAALNLVEPILREPHIEIFIKDKDNGIAKKEYIKAFKDENKTRLYMLITQDNDTILRIFITDTPERYVRNHVRNADIIHSFIQPNRTAKSDNALSDVVVYGNNPTPKPLTDQEDLLKTSENLNETTPKPTHLSPLEQANAEKLLKEQRATTPLKEFGTNYPEFALKPKEALEKLLQEKNGQVAGAAYRDDLGGIDFVWGTPKTKDSVGYGLAHVLERREQQALNKGLNEQQAKEYALNVIKSIPEIIDKGVKVDNNGRIAIEYQNIRVGLKDNWKGEKLPNHWIITGYEKLENSESLYTSPLITKSEILPLNSVESNPTPKDLTDQEDLLKTSENLNETTKDATNLSPLELANAKKLLKEQHAITPLKEFGTNYPEFALKPKEALEKLLQEKNGQVAGAMYREDLGGIDFVWGNKDYGLEHILEKRKKQYKRLGLTNEQAKERTNELTKEIPNIIQKGLKEEDKPGYAVIILNHSKVVLSKFKGDNELKNHYMITSFEVDEKVLRELETIATLSNDYRDGINYSTSNLIEPNPTTNTIKTQAPLSSLELANAKKLLKEQRAITPLKEFGKNYPEFALKPKEALEKLLQEKNGQVAGAAFRDDLGGIDFVWGKDGKDGYGLAHILEKRKKQYTRLGLNTEQIKERTDELLKSIPEVIENGKLFKDDLGRVSVEVNNIRVGLKNTWDNNNLNNHFVVTSYERDEKVLRELETKPPLSNDYKDNSNYSALNLNENNSTKESLKSQEPPLSILEKSQLEKEKKLESERLAKAEKEHAQRIKYEEEAELRNKIRAQKNAMMGKSELDREIAKSENIPYKEPENAPKTSVSLNDDEIYPLKFVIVNKSDLKPNFKNMGTQTRTAVDSKKVEEIAERFDPKLIIGRGGFDDLPIILRDGQVIAGNHRIQGMLNFNAESRKKYEQALKENFNIRLKPNELLVRMPEQELNDKEIFKLASKSNENRANSFSDTLLSAMSSYNDKLKHLPPKFESDSVENLANQVARVLERDAKIPSATQVENANLSLLSHYARNTPNNSFLEVFDNAYKNLDREQFKAFREMFANNSANFHNLNNDTTIKNFTISPYLTDALDTTAKMLESGNRSDNFSKLAHDIDYLVNSTDENGMNAFIKENKHAYKSVISQLLGSSFARFLRLENPSAQFYEFLVKAKDQMIENTADIFTGTSKPISEINIFDFIKYGIESGNSSKESRELLNLLPELEKKFNAHEKFLKGNKK